MSSGRSRIATLALAIATLLGFTGAGLTAELKLGATLSLTGGTDDYGRAAHMGLQLAVKEYNAKGGYKGQPVQIVVYDDETKPQKGVENVTRLITRDKVFGIVGPVNSGVALAIIDIAQKNEMPLMDTIATAEQIIDRYAKANGYTVVLGLDSNNGTVIWADDSVDITNALVSAYDAETPATRP